MLHTSGLSRQDTVPAKNPSWSYSPVPGQPAPIPPRNESLLFIPNHTAHDSASESYLKNLSKIHLLPGAISEGNPRIETLETSSTNIINPGHHLDKYAVLNTRPFDCVPSKGRCSSFGFNDASGKRVLSWEIP